MRHPQAREADAHAAEADHDELDALAQQLAAAVLAERPVAVADPVGERSRCVVEMTFAIRRGPRAPFSGLKNVGAQQVEHAEVDDEADDADDAEAGELAERACASVLPHSPRE